ncbi:hypothetical protein IWQ60_009535 [Tieghemiomyces parasiticus]|uniref:Rhodanese domain-containing protein n=1 Tax=Tieghemiomyces parasiticus TaxID=78921 RepID=A0A9W8DL00_9FUNG|nr:hypothetical protein IWQ60_009535 [Tieghemiomyces parasiticus]
MGVLGRIYLSTEGINGQISCPAARTADLAPFFARFEEFCTLTFNEALDHTESFQRLAVNIREQIVRDHVPATKAAIGPAPTALTPEEWHRQLSGEATAETHTLIDMRNNYESSVGYFRHALKPDVTRFADEIRILPELVRGKEREPVYMYCTGGIRCTKAGALLRARGFQDVRMLAGGITAYGRFIQRTGQPSLYVGKNFTFDQRLGEDVTDDVVGTCYQCGASCDRFTNCASSACNTLFLQCPTCATAYHRTCADRRCLDHVRAPTHPSASPPAQEACRWQHRERVDPTIVRTRITHNLAALRVSGEHSDDGTAQ